MNTRPITLDEVKQDSKIKLFLEAANNQMNAIGYTEHGFRHAGIVADRAKNLLLSIGINHRDSELAAIAGYLHDVGNSINRNSHPETSGLLSLWLLNDMGMAIDEIATVIAAIGNHEEGQGAPVSAISAAVIIADKSDVHNSRVQNLNPLTFDIHDRVNFSVQKSSLEVDKTNKVINLEIITDDKSATVMEYFEIFITRMIMCKLAADFLGYHFKLIINGMAM